MWCSDSKIDIFINQVKILGVDSFFIKVRASAVWLYSGKIQGLAPEIFDTLKTHKGESRMHARKT